MTQQEEVIDALETLVAFLREHRVSYGQIAAGVLATIRADGLTPGTSAEAKAMFGAMGSLTDVYVTRRNGHAVVDEASANRRLRELTDDLWRALAQR